MTTSKYVLISACRNEDAYLDGLVDCIAAQTLRPARWVIVDDASTDRTYDKASAAAQTLECLTVVRMEGQHGRSFSSQVYAANHGYETVKSEEFDYIGFLDADIRVAPSYYETLVRRMDDDRTLGLCGGAVIDIYPGRSVNSRRGSEEYHVAGGVQFFRREAFEQIGGGYVPIDGGGQDSIADVLVSMSGWKIRTFTDLPVDHLRPDGFAKQNAWRRGMNWGRKFYLLGYHPMFFLAQCFRRIALRPVVLGSLFSALGFMWATCRREVRPVTEEFVAFVRASQIDRLRKFVRSTLSFKSQ